MYTEISFPRGDIGDFMEINSSLIVKVVKNERTYQFIIPAGAPYGELVDASFEVFMQMDSLRTQQLEKVKQDKEKKKEDEVTEVDAEVINIQ
jgi:hypothetical protein